MTTCPMVNSFVEPLSRAPRLSTAVLLGGHLKQPALADALGMSLLDLPLVDGRALLEYWCDLLGTLNPCFGIRLLLSHGSVRPMTMPAAQERTRLEGRHDVELYRGPAGVLRDGCLDVEGEETILCAEANRIVMADLNEMLTAHCSSDADVTVIANNDGTPAGMYLLQRHTLDCVPSRGFFDLKEQWLTRVLEQGMAVRVFVLNNGVSLRVRSLADAISAVGALGSRGYVDPGADVSHRARVQDSIIMHGSIVEEDSVVVRSVVGPGGRVRRGQEVVDMVIGSSNRHGVNGSI